MFVCDQKETERERERDRQQASERTELNRTEQNRTNELQFSVAVLTTL